MTAASATRLRVNDEFSPLQRVVIGLGAPFQRDRERVAAEMREFPLVPRTARRAEVLALNYPDEALLVEEYAGFVAALEKHGVEVLRADPDAAYSFDYTCPRDIGFVVGERFFIANMAVSSRADEIETLRHLLPETGSRQIFRPPPDCLLEGGDVIQLDRETLLAGFHRRSNRRGCDYLRDTLAPSGIRVYPVEHRRLHLDCCLNPLGLGHLLIHPRSLVGLDAETRRLLERYAWIEVDDVECEHLATNLLSIGPACVVARDHPACARVVERLRDSGYAVESVTFDGVPATGGSFRCASLVLARRDAT